MKEKIENKLGCTIEELFVRIRKHVEEFDGYETEGSVIPDTLSIEELEFIDKCFEDITKNKGG